MRLAMNEKPGPVPNGGGSFFSSCFRCASRLLGAAVVLMLVAVLVAPLGRGGTVGMVMLGTVMLVPTGPGGVVLGAAAPAVGRVAVVGPVGAGTVAAADGLA